MRPSTVPYPRPASPDHLASANRTGRIDAGKVQMVGAGFMSDEAYHGVVLAALLRAGIAHIRRNSPALVQRLVPSSGRTGAVGSPR